MKRTELGDLHLGLCTSRIDNTTIRKPRNARTEEAWRAFLLALEKEGLQYLPDFAEIIEETEDSHLVKIITNEETDAEGARNYYRRCGSMLCIIWLLGGSDFHEENIIAHGERPVFVDLETLMGGTVERTSALYEKSLASSVNSTHMLAQLDQGEDTSGLSGIHGQNRPHINGKIAPVQEYLNELLEGFEQAFNFVLTHKEFVIENLHVFNDCSFREIIRPTPTYQKYLLYIDERVKAADERYALAEKICRIAYERDADPDRINKAALLLQAESFALSQGWIPIFHTHGDSRDLFSDGRQLEKGPGENVVMQNFFRMSPVETATNRIQKLTEADLIKQEAIIKMVMHALEPLPDVNTTSVVESGATWSESILKSLHSDIIPDLPSRYMKMVMSGGKGYWTSLAWGLYDGAVGVLCALAAMGEEQNELFQKLYKEMEEYLINTEFSTKLSALSCGLSDGIAGMIAALIHIDELVGEIECSRNGEHKNQLAENSKYKTAAYQLLSRFENQLQPNQTTDVLTGLGGLCLQLPKLPCEKSRELARTILPEMIKAETKLTGAAHGKAGLALALGALQKTLNTNEADERILELLQEENALYDKENKNWPDLRQEDKTGFMHGWCSGAPGIGMCRKKLMEYTSNEQILKICKDDCERVKEYLLSCKELKRDTLCCGNASRLMAATYLGVELPESVTDKTEQQNSDTQKPILSDLSQTLARSTSPNAPRLFHAQGCADHNISLMQGMMGVAYVLACSDMSRESGFATEGQLTTEGHCTNGTPATNQPQINNHNFCGEMLL